MEGRENPSHVLHKESVPNHFVFQLTFIRIMGNVICVCWERIVNIIIKLMEIYSWNGCRGVCEVTRYLIFGVRVWVCRTHHTGTRVWFNYRLWDGSTHEQDGTVKKGTNGFTGRTITRGFHRSGVWWLQFYRRNKTWRGRQMILGNETGEIIHWMYKLYNKKV